MALLPKQNILLTQQTRIVVETISPVTATANCCNSSCCCNFNCHHNNAGFLKLLTKCFAKALQVFPTCSRKEKNGFVTATKLGTTNKFFVAATKNFATATERFADRTKHFVVVTKYFCYPYFNK